MNNARPVRQARRAAQTVDARLLVHQHVDLNDGCPVGEVHPPRDDVRRDEHARGRVAERVRPRRAAAL